MHLRANLVRCATIAAALLAVGVGCQQLPEYKHAPTAVLLTEGVRITRGSGDQGWELRSGESVPTPIRSSFRAGLSDGKLFHIERGHPKYPKKFGMPVIDALGEALRKRAQMVEVFVSGRAKPLYGVLALCPLAQNTPDSSVRRTYRIQIPAQRIEQATGGRISVVYEPYLHPDPGGFTWGWERDYDAIAWILWLSDAPLSRGGPTWDSQGHVER
jgi:hypothetical protein